MGTTNENIDAWAAALARGESIQFHSSRAKTVGMSIVSLVFTVICLAMAFGAEIPWNIVGWVGIALFVLGIAVNVRSMFSHAPGVVVSPEGVAMKTAKAGVVPWAQIIDVRAVKQNSNVFIELAITKPEADRQSGAGLGVAEQKREDGSTEQFLWLPNGLAVKKPELCLWLVQEHEARTAT